MSSCVGTPPASRPSARWSLSRRCRLPILRAPPALWAWRCWQEFDLDKDYELDEGLIVEHREMASPTLYATMPTLESFQHLLRLWHAYQRGRQLDTGYAPWRRLFDMLDDLRAWGPEDRLSADACAELEARLPIDGTVEVRLELEVWPTRSRELRERRRREAERRVEALGGRVVSRSSIEEEGFVYEALLVALSADAVRQMLEEPSAPEGLAILDGLQFVLPQVVAQSQPNQSEPLDAPGVDGTAEFDADIPLRAVLLDGTPVAGHRSLDGGVIIEDVHDLVSRSVVEQRRHATSMASLILRGDLAADGVPVQDSRLLCIPVLVDAGDAASSPEDRLFVDVVHVALTRAFAGEEPLAPAAFVVNFSVGIRGSNFAGRISSLARLLDWWAYSEGVLFVVSSGNVLEDLVIPGMTSVAFEDATLEKRRELVLAAQRDNRHERRLLAPSEALNVLTVGAASVDLAPAGWAPRPGEAAIQDEEELAPVISTAHGPGPFGSIKPDVLPHGGRHDVRALAAGGNLRLRVIRETGRSGVLKGWHPAMKNGHLDARMIKRGTIWSRRMVHDCVRVPEFEEGASLPIRVQCRDASGGGLNPDDEIGFAIAVALEVTDRVRYDMHQEVRDALLVRVRDAG